MERAYRTFVVQLTMLQTSMFHFDAFDRQRWEKTFEEDPEEDYEEDGEEDREEGSEEGTGDQ